LKGHTVEDAGTSEQDVLDVEAAIRNKKSVNEVFPHLETIGVSVDGGGINVTVHFTKRQGAPVHFVAGGAGDGTAPVREIDFQRRFPMQATDLAEAVGLSSPKCYAVRAHLGIDNDPKCRHDWTFKRQKITGFSEVAAQRIRDALPTLDLDAVWDAHRPRAAGRGAARPG
jgi:hypothetical protein